MRFLIEILITGLIGLVLSMVLNGILRGEMSLNFRTYRRDRSPISYWFAMVISCVVLYLCCSVFLNVVRRR